MVENQNTQETHVTFWIPNEDLVSFDRIAKEKRISRAALLRTCVLEVNRKNKVKL